MKTLWACWAAWLLLVIGAVDAYAGRQGGAPGPAGAGIACLLSGGSNCTMTGNTLRTTGSNNFSVGQTTASGRFGICQTITNGAGGVCASTDPQVSIVPDVSSGIIAVGGAAGVWLLVNGTTEVNVTNTGVALTRGMTVATTLGVTGAITASSALNKGSKVLAAGTGTVTVTSGAKCVCSDETSVAAVQCSVSGTTLTINGTGTDTITYHCF